MFSLKQPYVNPSLVRAYARYKEQYGSLTKFEKDDDHCHTHEFEDPMTELDTEVRENYENLLWWDNGTSPEHGFGVRVVDTYHPMSRQVVTTLYGTKTWRDLLDSDAAIYKLHHSYASCSAYFSRFCDQVLKLTDRFDPIYDYLKKMKGDYYPFLSNFRRVVKQFWDFYSKAAHTVYVLMIFPSNPVIGEVSDASAAMLYLASRNFSSYETLGNATLRQLSGLEPIAEWAGYALSKGHLPVIISAAQATMLSYFQQLIATCSIAEIYYKLHQNQILPGEIIEDDVSSDTGSDVDTNWHGLADDMVTPHEASFRGFVQQRDGTWEPPQPTDWEDDINDNVLDIDM